MIEGIHFVIAGAVISFILILIGGLSFNYFFSFLAFPVMVVYSSAAIFIDMKKGIQND